MYGSDLKSVERSFVIELCRKKRRDELCRLFAVILPRRFDRVFTSKTRTYTTGVFNGINYRAYPNKKARSVIRALCFGAANRT